MWWLGLLTTILCATLLNAEEPQKITLKDIFTSEKNINSGDATPSLRVPRQDKFYLSRYGSPFSDRSDNGARDPLPAASSRSLKPEENAESSAAPPTALGKRCTKCDGKYYQDGVGGSRGSYPYERDRYETRPRYDPYEDTRYYDDYRGRYSGSYDRDRYDRYDPYYERYDRYDYDRYDSRYNDRGYDSRGYERGSGYDNRGYDYNRGGGGSSDYDNRLGGSYRGGSSDYYGGNSRGYSSGGYGATDYNRGYGYGSDTSRYRDPYSSGYRPRDDMYNRGSGGYDAYSSRGYYGGSQRPNDYWGGSSGGYASNWNYGRNDYRDKGHTSGSYKPRDPYYDSMYQNRGTSYLYGRPGSSTTTNNPNESEENSTQKPQQDTASN